MKTSTSMFEAHPNFAGPYSKDHTCPGTLLLLALVALALNLPSNCSAQWVQQTIQLRPGWNAIFLEIEPTPQDCDTLFAGLPVESVWDFNRVVDLPQFVQDPTTLTPGAPGWLTWFPATHPLSGQTSLFILRDGRPYLVKVASNAAPATLNLTLTGRPSLRRTSWYSGGLNLVGFHVNSTGPSFQSLFAGEGGLAGQPVYSLEASGVWRRLQDLSTARPRSGEAYWIRCAAPAQRAGTVVLEMGARGGLEFEGGQEQTLRIRNSGNAPRNITVRLVASSSPPAGMPPLAGPVPLVHWQNDFVGTNAGWTPLTGPLTYTGLPAAQDWLIRLGARVPAGGNPRTERYQSLLEVTDDAGTRWVVPVSAGANSNASAAARPGLAGDEGQTARYAGLWVGDAILKAVSQPARNGDSNTPRPAGGEFGFRLLLHVDDQGVARLLRQVHLIRKPAVIGPDPENPGTNRIVSPARTLAITDEDLIPSLVGTGEIIGRRLSSAAFGFQDPVALSGASFGAGTLNGTVVLDYQHPLNPFQHRFHPDHNNLDERFEQPQPDGRESFTVTRVMSLEFSSTDPLGLNPPGWGQTELGGTYRESITGLHRSSLQVSGTFRLVRLATAAALNQ